MSTAFVFKPRPLIAFFAALTTAAVGLWIWAGFYSDDISFKYHQDIVQVHDGSDGFSVAILLDDTAVNSWSPSIEVAHFEDSKPSPCANEFFSSRNPRWKFAIGHWGLAHTITPNPLPTGKTRGSLCSIYFLQLPYYVMVLCLCLSFAVLLRPRGRPEMSGRVEVRWLLGASRWFVVIFGIKTFILFGALYVSGPLRWGTLLPSSVSWILSLPLTYSYTDGPSATPKSVLLFVIANIVNCAVLAVVCVVALFIYKRARDKSTQNRIGGVTAAG